MRPKSLILLALALGCGLAASVGISQIMDANANRPATDVNTTPIYVALHNINLGDPINANMVTLQEWPSNNLPKGAMTSIEGLQGRRPRTTIVAGTPLLEAHLLAQDELADPLANIPPEYRLSTISVDAEKSSAGLLSPGDRVDVQLFVAANTRNNIPESMTKVILQNIRVFAVEQAVQRTAEGDESKSIPKTVSLLVKPEQASKLDLAQNLGKLSLIPRNPNDETSTTHVEVSVDDLLGSRSNLNKRVEEQAREATSTKPGLLSTIYGMMKASSENHAKAPFRMEIVEAEDVSEMLFDPDTDTPLADQSGTYGGSRKSILAHPMSFSPETPTKANSGPGQESDFPIDLNEDEETPNY